MTGSSRVLQGLGPVGGQIPSTQQGQENCQQGAQAENQPAANPHHEKVDQQTQQGQIQQERDCGYHHPFS